MIIFWFLFKDDGGFKIINYVIEKREFNRKIWVYVISEFIECMYIIFKLFEGYEYVFRIMV